MGTNFDPFENHASHLDAGIIIEQLQVKQKKLILEVRQRFEVQIQGESGIMAMGSLIDGKWLSQLRHLNSGRVIYDWWGVGLNTNDDGRQRLTNLTDLRLCIGGITVFWYNSTLDKEFVPIVKAKPHPADTDNMKVVQIIFGGKFGIQLTAEIHGVGKNRWDAVNRGNHWNFAHYLLSNLPLTDASAEVKFTRITFGRPKVIKLLQLCGLDQSAPNLCTRSILEPRIKKAFRTRCDLVDEELSEKVDIVYSALQIFESFALAKKELKSLVDMAIKCTDHSKYLQEVHDKYDPAIKRRLDKDYGRDLITVYSTDRGWFTGQLPEYIKFEDLRTCFTG